MIIGNYKILIQNLPVRQQSFTTNRDNKKWSYAENKYAWFKDFNNKHFDNGKLSISRQDIFNIDKSPKEKIIKTIFWGYPNGMQGGHKNFDGILKNIDTLECKFKELQKSNELTSDDLEKAQKDFKSIPGLGLSTYSKLLYFFEIKIDKIPCLIIDQRLLDIFNSSAFEDFALLTKMKSSDEKKYFACITLINKIAQQLETKGENIEQFLFIFGKNLKV